MKTILFIFLFYSINLFSQVDTVCVNRDVINSKIKAKSLGFVYNVKYYINGKKVNPQKYNKYKKYCEWYSQIQKDRWKNIFYYYKFYNKNGILVSEGYDWNMETYGGKYKYYYKNGKIRIKAENDIEGNHINVTYYYNRKGKIKKEIKY